MTLTLDRIHSFLVHPDKNKDEQTSIPGTEVRHEGRLYEMLRDIFEKADEECPNDITFDASPDGLQRNECRDLLISYLKDATLANGLKIADRLQRVTSGRSGLGLLFVLSGKQGHDKKIVLSRFPADNAILAEESSDGLSVEFLEKVFMKSATAYKAAMYRGRSLEGNFWDGKAVDKQINSELLTISNYWIRDFLASDFKATGAHGTRRLASALLGAMKTESDPSVKQEFVAAAKLASALSGKAVSMRDFCQKLLLSDGAKKAIRQYAQNDAVFNEKFTFNGDEFSRHITVRAVELNNGAILVAPAEEFDTVFRTEIVNTKTEEIRYSTQGQVVKQRLGRR